MLRVTEPFDEYSNSKFDIRYSMVRSIEYLLVEKGSTFDEVRYSIFDGSIDRISGGFEKV